jgi:isopenicillin-N epimerase
MDTTHHQRRAFLRKLSAASLAALTVPAIAHASGFQDLGKDSTERDEAYWELVKDHFAVPNNLVMMNAANLCPAPYVINDQVMAFLQGLARDVSFQYRAQFADIRKRSLSALAEFMGVSPAEVGITRNTSEANCLLVNGIDFKAGDEIVLWDQNHPSNKESWMNRAKRSGVVVKVVSVPVAPKSVGELLEPFAKAITSKTRLISFSHISNLSGIMLPAREICSLAKSKGVLTLVDGAQSLGYMDIDLRAMGCDFFTASTHKWLMGPMENGVLYINQSHLDKVWPNVVGGGWHDNSASVDEKLCVLGQRNETTIAALRQMVLFHYTIGKVEIEKRVKFLAGYLKGDIGSIKGATIVTPMPGELSGGVVVFQLAGKNPADVVQLLYSKYGIAAAPSGGIRLSPHVYNTLSDADVVLDAVRDIAKS